MDSSELKAVQAPLKARYREDPQAALVTLHAEGTLGAERHERRRGVLPVTLLQGALRGLELGPILVDWSSARHATIIAACLAS